MNNVSTHIQIKVLDMIIQYVSECIEHECVSDVQTQIQII